MCEGLISRRLIGRRAEPPDSLVCYILSFLPEINTIPSQDTSACPRDVFSRATSPGPRERACR